MPVFKLASLAKLHGDFIMSSESVFFGSIKSAFAQIFWVAGPTWMLAITALLVFSLIVTDHIAPAKQQRKSKDIETGTSKPATSRTS